MTERTYLVATCACGVVANILEELARDTVLPKLIHKIDCCRHPRYDWQKEGDFGIQVATGLVHGTTGLGMPPIDGSGLWSPLSGVIAAGTITNVSSAVYMAVPQRGPTGSLLKVELDDSLEDLVDEKKERMERVIQGFW